MSQRRRRSRNATESTSKAGEDRSDARDPQTPTSRSTETIAAGEIASPKNEVDGRPDGKTGPAADRQEAEKENRPSTRTEAKAKVVIAPRKGRCPKCGEKRFEQEIGAIVKCPNCRNGVELA